MKKYTFLMILLTAFAPAAFAQKGLEKVSWLTGCWSGEMKNGSYQECWTTAEGGLMQGSGRLTGNGKIFMREHMTIEVEGEDLVMYILNYGAGLKADGPVVPFKLTKSSAAQLVFENPKHDYPQRIVYTKDANGDIVARIEQMDGTKPMNFPMNRPRPKTDTKTDGVKKP